MRQPHAVIVLPNNVEIDARAHRNGLALTEAGFKVTMLGFGPADSGAISGIPYHVLFTPTRPKKLSITYRVVRKSFHLAARRRPPAAVLKAVGKVDAATSAAQRALAAAKKRVTAPRVTPSRPDPTTWQGMLPFIPDMEKVLMPKLIELEPDLIIPDVHLLHLANTAAQRFRNQGRKVAVLYDAREYVYGLASDDRNVLEGFPALEAEQIRQCDAVVTVCEPIAQFLHEKYDIPVPPLVPNAPIGNLPRTARPMTIRDFLDIPADAPLMAYAGGLSVHRGVHDAVEALTELPGVHLALGARRPSSYTLELEELATRLGVRDRLHFVPFAPTHEVAEYLASATLAVFPFLPVGNHNWAAPNKYFESVQARLPIITSNMEWLGERVTRLGIGEVFEHSNPSDLARAARLVLADLDRYRALITDELVAEHTFEHFSGALIDTCLEILPDKLRPGLRPVDVSANLRSIRRDMLGQRARLADSDLFEPRPRLRIGTANSAGQARMWAHSLMREYPRVIAESVWLHRDQPMGFPVDEIITPAQQHTPFWQQRMKNRLEDRVTHVLHESGRPLVGSAFGRAFWQESAWMSSVGIRQGLVFHGSDIRNPRRHAELEPCSPFADPGDEEMAELTQQLQRSVDRITPHVLAFDGPVFVTTPDLLDYLPDATVLPVVVDTDLWHSDLVPLSGAHTPAVFHIPNKSGLKGSDVVDAVCERLEAEGLIRYVREENLPHTRVRQHMLESDIVVDQLRVGDYGLTAVEAMSSGKVVIGHIADRVLARYETEPPIVRATCATFEEVLRSVIADRERAADLGRRGREYAVAQHDGRRSAQILASFVGEN